MKANNYVLAQYLSEGARDMILHQFLRIKSVPLTEDRKERCAQYMRDVLRIGGIRACRNLIAEAIRWHEVQSG